MKLSICMATYNGEKFLKAQIDSILSQLDINDELIISDDGSTDNTIAIIEGYSDERITLLKNIAKHGFINNFENALKHASGDYIFLCDQDDVWKQNKIKIMIEALQKADLVVHDADIVDKDLNKTGKTYYSTMHNSSNFLMNLYKTRFLGCCMAFNHNVLLKTLPFPEGIDGHDYWIGMYALLHFKVKFISDILILYRRHGVNASSSSEKSHKSLYWRFFVKRLGILRALFFHRRIKGFCL